MTLARPGKHLNVLTAPAKSIDHRLVPASRHPGPPPRGLASGANKQSYLPWTDIYLEMRPKDVSELHSSSEPLEPLPYPASRTLNSPNPVPTSTMYLSVLIPALLALPSLLSATPLGDKPPGKHDCHGSFACLLMPSGACNIAVLGYEQNQTYPGYTARIATKDNKAGGKGCTAIFYCDEDSAYANVTGDGRPANGTYLSEMFAALFTFDACGKCGHQTLINSKCHVRTDYCAHCQPTPTNLTYLTSSINISSNVTNVTLTGITASNATSTIALPRTTATVGTS